MEEHHISNPDLKNSGAGNRSSQDGYGDPEVTYMNTMA